MRSDEMGQKTRGAAPEPAEGTEARLDEGFETDDDTLDAFVGGGGVMGDSGCEHNWRFVRREKGLIWGYNDIYVCTKCDAQKAEWV